MEILWRYSLIHGEKSLLSNTDIPKNSIVICNQQEYRLFSLFNPYSSFIKYLYKSKIRNFYEIIFGNKPQKPYFDIDIDLKEKKDWNIEKAEKLIKDMCNFMINDNKYLNLSDILIFSSHGDEKLSYHIVLDRWCFPDHLSNKYYCDKVINSVQNNDVIDKSMYKSLQQFRIFTCSKYLKNRIKILDKLSTWKHKHYETIDMDNPRHFYDIVESSLITTTSFCKVMGYFVPEKALKQYSSEDLTEEQITKITNISMIKDGIFQIIDFKNKLVALKRLKPSYCDICTKIHENENPFLTVDENLDLWFHCRRSSNKIFIQNLNPPAIKKELKENFYIMLKKKYQ